MKCEQCGKDLAHPKAKKPYEYNGYLKPCLPLILSSLRDNIEIGLIAEMCQLKLKRLPPPDNWWGDFSPSNSSIRGLIRHIARKSELAVNEANPVFGKEPYRSARDEHAWLLRAEGLSLQIIGDRLGGLSRERVRQIIFRFGLKVTKKRTKFKLCNEGIS